MVVRVVECPCTAVLMTDDRMTGTNRVYFDSHKKHLKHDLYRYN